MPELPQHIFRISRGTYASTPIEALSGIGGEMAPGRWHTMGQRVVYCASTRALCLLERLVHGDEWLTEISHDRVYLDVQLAGVSHTHFTAGELTAYDADWRRDGAPLCRAIGDKWLKERKTYALLVPSAVVPEEYNVLLNPSHLEHGEAIRQNFVMHSEPVVVDTRMAKVLHLKTGKTSK